MTIIFVNRFFHPDHSATSQLLSDLAFALARQGRTVEVIASRLAYSEASRVLPARETIEGVTVRRIWTTRFGRGTLKGRALDYVTFHAAAAWLLWRRVQRGDVVVAMTDPPLLSIITTPICRWHRAFAIHWLQDLFPEVASPRGAGGGARGIGFAALRALRDHSLRQAAMNVVIGARMAAHLTHRGVETARVRLIPNWADGVAITPVDHAANPFRAGLGGHDALVIGYSGNLGRVHEIDTVLEAMTIMTRRDDHAGGAGRDILWLFVGDGALMPRLRAEVTRRALANVVFKPYQARETLAWSLSAPDLHLVFLRPEFEGLVVPSKVYGIAAAGRAILFVGDGRGEVADLIARHGCGTTVATGDGVGLARVIADLARQPCLIAKLGQSSRRAFESEFSATIAIARWESVLDQLALPAK
jgi:glycosyltransferase involved in cell wall biosynthesis